MAPPKVRSALWPFASPRVSRTSAAYGYGAAASTLKPTACTPQPNVSDNLPAAYVDAAETAVPALPGRLIDTPNSWRAPMSCAGL